MAKYAAAALILSAGAEAFVGPASSAGRTSVAPLNAKSIALPWQEAPPGLDGTLPGDVGFDPFGFTNNLPTTSGPSARSLKWYREAELIHGRICMLATLGVIFPEIYHFPGNEGVGMDVFSELNALKAFYTVPDFAIYQILLFAGAVEIWRLRNTVLGDRPAGDLNLGQFGAYNPAKLNFSEEEYFLMQTREIKHCRLAMIGFLGQVLQLRANGGQPLLQQLGEAFTVPEAVSKAGYFFPEGL